MSTIHVGFDLPEDVLVGMRRDQETFVRELRLVAAVKWYEMRQVSQARAAELAGISRAEFIASLAAFGVSPFQVSADELVREAGGE